MHGRLDLRALLVVVEVLAGCADDPAQQALIVDVVGPAGTRLHDVDQAQVLVARGAGPLLDSTAPLDADGSFSLDFPLVTSADPFRAAVVLTGPTTRYIATLPPFHPSETSGFVRMIAAPAGACTEIALSREPRAEPAVVLSQTFAILLGGEPADAPPLAYVDLLRAEAASYPETMPAFGPTRAIAIDEHTVLALTDTGAYRVEPTAADTRIEPLEITHRGTLVALDGAAVILADDTPSTAITFVTPTATRTASLSTPRTSPIAARVGDSILVASDGTFETVRIADGRAQPLDLELAPPVAFVPHDAELLALHADGTSTLLTGCPAACATAPGPDWPARPQIAIAFAADRDFIVGGGVDVVTFGPAAITPLSGADPASRSAVAFGAGALLVLDEAATFLCIPEDLSLP